MHAFTNAGLNLLSHFEVRTDRLVCQVSLLIPTTITSNLHNDNNITQKVGNNKQSEPKYEQDELVIAITDVSFASSSDSSMGTSSKKSRRAVLELLRSCDADQVAHLPLRSAGLVEEEVAVHKAVLQMASETLRRIGDQIALRALNASIGMDTVFTSATNNNHSTSTHSNQTTTAVMPRFAKLRVVGYSLGASVGSYVAMLLDGGLNISLSTVKLDDSDKLAGAAPTDNDNKAHQTKTTKKRKKKSSKTQSTQKDSIVTSETSIAQTDVMNSSISLGSVGINISQEDCIGLYSKRVQCICIAPFPCISRVIVPQYVSSLICGDDIVPRATPEAMTKLRTRLREVSMFMYVCIYTHDILILIFSLMILIPPLVYIMHDLRPSKAARAKDQKDLCVGAWAARG